MNNDDEAEELSGEDLQVLFRAVCRALQFDALRLKERERRFLNILVSESFGEGLAWGVIDLKAWRLRLSSWRSNEVKNMLEDWRRAGWVMVDQTEKTFRLAPDRFPGWADVRAIEKSEQRQLPLKLMTDDDLHKMFARLAQSRSLEDITKISQVVTEISQRRPESSNFEVESPVRSTRVESEKSFISNRISSNSNRGWMEDEYVRQKLSIRPRLSQELVNSVNAEGKRTSLRENFETLWQSDPDKARELIGLAVLPEVKNANAWLNRSLRRQIGLESL